MRLPKNKQRPSFISMALPLLLAAMGAGIIGTSPSILAPSALAIAPGAGIWATMVGAGLLLCGLWCAALEWRARSPRNDKVRHQRRVSPAFCGMVLASLLWMALLPLAGWVAASVLALALACRSAQTGLWKSLALIVLLVGGLYLGVEVLMNTPLPRGLLGDWLSADAVPAMIGLSTSLRGARV